MTTKWTPPTCSHCEFVNPVGGTKEYKYAQSDVGVDQFYYLCVVCENLHGTIGNMNELKDHAMMTNLIRRDIADLRSRLVND